MSTTYHNKSDHWIVCVGDGGLYHWIKSFTWRKKGLPTSGVTNDPECAKIYSGVKANKIIRYLKSKGLAANKVHAYTNNKGEEVRRD